MLQLYILVWLWLTSYYSSGNLVRGFKITSYFNYFKYVYTADNSVE